MQTNSFTYDLVNKLFEYDEKIVLSFAKEDGIEQKSSKNVANDILTRTSYFVNEKITNEKIIILSRNNYDCFIVFFSILASGNIAVVINPDLPDENIVYLVEKSDAILVLSDDSHMNHFNNLFNGKIKVDNLLKNMNINEPITISEIYSYKENDTVAMLCTSGTTGNSKLVEYNDKSLCLLANRYHNEKTLMDNYYVTGQFYHLICFAAVIGYLYKGKRLCFSRDNKYLLEDIKKFEPNIMICVPSLLSAINKLHKSNINLFDILGKNIKIIIVVGAKCSPALIEEFSKNNIFVMSAYAMTETPEEAFTSIIDEKHIDTVGKDTGLYQIKIAKDNELLLKGDSIMKGYYRDIEETQKTIVDGWLHTGDLVKKDIDDYYYLIGRKKNTIILENGENVNPEEIESKLLKNQEIIECMVYDNGVEICCDIYTQSNINEVEKYIKDYNSTCPSYHKINKINFCGKPLEKTPSGKIIRRKK